MKDSVTPTFGARYMTQPIPKYALPKESMPPDAAYQLIHDELQVQGNPVLNMASFVTTVMDEQAERLIAENLGVNYIDTEVYRGALEIQNRCIKILGNLFNAPNLDKVWGTETVGSSEALMICALSHKRAWQERRKAEGKSIDKPNIVMGNDVHITWNKYANYFDVEQKLIPLHPERFTITAEEVKAQVDENTTCVVAVLGTSYTFDYDPIKEINDALLEIKKEKGWDIPLHVDGASGAFIAPFLSPDLEWDFRLEQVKSINVSGHKFGLVYPGIGWAIWRDLDDVPQSLFAETNVLGFIERTFCLNFSRGSAMILAQYYNFIRLGWDGYYKIMHTMRENARYLAAKLEGLGKFDILNAAEKVPCVIVKLKDDTKYNVADVSAALSQHGWIVPAFSLPADADQVHVMRMVCKETFSRDMADILVKDFQSACEHLEAVHSKPHGTVGSHHR